MENFILDSEALELNHPFLLVREKQKILEKIHSKYQDENKNISNYAKNYEITNILSRYQYYGKKLAKKQNIKKRMKKPEDFNTIMEEYQTKEQKAIQRNNFLKEKYFQEFIVKVDEIYDPEKNIPQSLNTSYENILALEKIEEKQNHGDQNEKKLQILNQKFAELLVIQKEEENIYKKKINSHVCHNSRLFSKIFDKMKDQILSKTFVYFDEIFDLLIDEILQEEVIYLNNLEKFSNYEETNDNSSVFEIIPEKNQKKSYVSPKMMQIFGQLSTMIDG